MAPIPPHVLPYSSRVPVQHLNVPCIPQMQPDDWDEPPSPDLAPRPMPNLAPQQYGSSEEEEEDEDTRITVVSVYLNTLQCHHVIAHFSGLTLTRNTTPRVGPSARYK